MLLAVDVGNTQTVLGLYPDGELADHWRLATERSTTAEPDKPAKRTRKKAAPKQA